MVPDVVSLTERLVRVDTAPGCSTIPLVGLLADELKALGAHVEVQEGQFGGSPQRNIIARFGGDGEAGLLLAGHIDTVPWATGQRATTTPERDGRTLYGRGTCDMKGAVAAQLLAATACRETLGRPLVMAWTYAEELGCHGALALVKRTELLGALGKTPCIVGEPTGLAPIIEHKGYGIVRIALTGEPAHSSDPWSGVDASVALATLLRDLHELREVLRHEGPADSQHEPPCTTLNTGLVSAGSARNVVPDRAEVTLEFRPLPGADGAELKRRITACVDLARGSVPGVTSEIEWLEERPAFRQDAGHRLVEFLSDRTGLAPDVVPFYTEAEIYRTGFGGPTVVCGPGSIQAAHRVDEFIDFDDLEAGFELYREAITEFCR